MIFWSDGWAGNALKESFPQLFSFTKKAKCSIRFFLNQELDRLFTLPLSVQAAVQLNEVESLLSDNTSDKGSNDIWSYSWGSSNFSSRKAYLLLIGEIETSPFRLVLVLFQPRKPQVLLLVISKR